MNYVLAVFIFTCILASVGQVRIPPYVGDVMEGSVAQKAGVQKGDLILAVNGKKVNDFMELKRAVVVSYYDQPIDLQIERDGQVLTLNAKPELIGEEKIPQLGVMSDASVEVDYKKLNPIAAFAEAVHISYQTTVDTLKYLGQVLTGRRSANDLRGPVGIAEASGDAAKGGWLSFILFLAQVSIGIGFVNLLPIPILDGGHLVFLGYEAIVRKPVCEKVQTALLKVGMLLLLALLCFTLFKDIPRVIGRVFGL